MKVINAAFLIGLCAADLPVHCLRSQVAGNWQFTLGKPSAERTTCGHQRPDAEMHQPDRSIVGDNPSKLQVSLTAPSVATAEGQRGTWTMIYDEGFSVEVAGYNFVAFS
mmetsp:Transcript_6363/g.15426  ORF Transcript_6363/g.15426 Transcript_6363/m.15426 type:complete len:109 (-) Transcript_6363:1246-1572(-)